MRRAVWIGALTLALAGPALSATLVDLMAEAPDADRCWQRIYDNAHLALHPDQLVTKMTFGAGFEPHDEATQEDPGSVFFGMDVKLRGGQRGTAGGGCWIGDEGQLRCGVDCDGGGVALELRDDGRLLIDLEATGYIRLEGECGGGDGYSSFPLEPGLDDKKFLLSAVDAKVCKGLIPSW